MYKVEKIKKVTWNCRIRYAINGNRTFSRKTFDQKTVDRKNLIEMDNSSKKILSKWTFHRKIFDRNGQFIEKNFIEIETCLNHLIKMDKVVKSLVYILGYWFERGSMGGATPVTFAFVLNY